MKAAKQAQREARQLFRLSVMNGSLDESRVREVVHRLIDGARPGMLSVLSRYHRLIRIDRSRHSAAVISAAPLSPEVRARLEAVVARLHGPGIVTSFLEDPALLGGVRIIVGSALYDGTVEARLAVLQARFDDRSRSER